MVRREARTSPLEVEFGQRVWGVDNVDCQSMDAIPVLGLDSV